jgi:hypothetical protein
VGTGGVKIVKKKAGFPCMEKDFEMKLGKIVKEENTKWQIQK